MKKFLLPLLLFATPALAYEELRLDEYFKVKENQDKFEFLDQSGKIKQLREQATSISICKLSAQDQENADTICECTSKEMKKLSDKEWFYTSMIAYQRYQAKAAALENNDTVELENINKLSQNNPLYVEKVGQVCTPK